jgi:spore photoproduct lyase
LAAAEKAAGAGYPLGFLIAPVFAAEGWEKDYRELFGMMADALNAADVGSCPGAGSAPTFEFITHRFTAKAKNIILKIFPETELEMKEETRKYKYGQFGYGKYVYHEELFQEIKSFLTSLVEQYFPASRIEYFV